MPSVLLLSLALSTSLALTTSRVPLGHSARARGVIAPRMQLPSALSRSENIVAGGATANLLYGKLQRAAQLPTTRFNANPIAAVTDKGALSSLLWSSFSMANVPSGKSMDPSALLVNGKGAAPLRGSLYFSDTTTNEPVQGGFKLPSFFGGGAQPSDPLAVIEAAGEELVHAFLICDGPAVDGYVAALERMDGRAPVTIIAPVDGVDLCSTKGWIQDTSVQDHEGVLVSGLDTQPGYVVVDGEGALVPCAVSGGGETIMAREDLAELAVQCALRLSHTEAEGAPPLRVVRASPDAVVASRPVRNYDSLLGGPKFRAAQGTVQSADWSKLLAPFGVIRASDPQNMRTLIAVDPTAEGTGGDEAVAAPAVEEEMGLEMAKESEGVKFGVAMTGGPEVGVVVTRVMPDTPAEQCGLLVSDTILAVNGAKVSAAREATREMQAAPVGTVVLQIARGREAAKWVVDGGSWVQE